MVFTDPNAINHLTKELYPTVGKCFNSTTFKVEGAMRHAIELVWNQRDKEAQRKIFDYKSNSMADKPTSEEFIALVTEQMSKKKTA
jgi:two-component system response regulator (stage 0 sporulation protein A)